jgi:GT2 family glycosyltransferase
MSDPAPFEEAQGLRVSAILVAYNQAAALRRAIQALENSTERERLEILVVDCGSQDGSTGLDAEFPSVNMLRLPHHLGAGRSMNIATRTAKADLLFFLSPNVEVGAETVARLAERLENEADVAVCPLLVDEQGAPVSRLRGLPTRESLRQAVAGVEPSSGAVDLSAESVAVDFPSLDALMVRKAFVRGMNYFDQRYGHYWLDAELAIQIRRAGKKVRLYPAIRATLHQDGDPLVDYQLARTDRVSGAAALVGKYEGAMAALTFRLGAALAALGRFDLGQFTGILSGRKLDGSQAP